MFVEDIRHMPYTRNLENHTGWLLLSEQKMSLVALINPS